jgi:hypothetical protein
VKLSEAEQEQQAHVRNVLHFKWWLWFFFFPVLGTVLFPVFSSGEPPAVQHAPPAFSCASQRAEDTVLGDGGSIAPLCGETPDPVVPVSDGGGDEKK